MNEMTINKRDLLTIVVLVIVFFSIAAWNLGMTNVPLTTWQTTENKSFYVSLGGIENVGAAYFLVKSGNATVEVYTGSPGNWSYSGVFTIEGYYVWSKLDISRSTQHLRFDFQPQPSSFSPPSYVEIAEMAVSSQDNQKLAINEIASENASDPSLSRLIDEQASVQIPPTYLSETYFDEIYFVRTAENYLHIQSPYEWTHPPLGKLIQAAGIVFFGYNPFGWRIMGVLFATLMIPVIYLLGKKLFGTWIGAFAAAFLLTFDFMHFTMGRMGTADTYLVFLSLTSQLFFLIYFKDVIKNGWKASLLPLLLAVLFFALSFSTKWVAIYGLGAELVLLVALRLKDVVAIKDGLAVRFKVFTDPPFFWVLGFLGVAVFVYFLTYVPDLLTGRTLLGVFQLQFSMYHYHSTLVATHPFASQWWSWPVMIKPLWLFVSNLPNNMKSTIVVLGNPAVWWIGFAAIFFAVERTTRKKELAGLFITVFFFFQWLPYILISRLTFIYHFYLDVPFLCLASAYLATKLWGNKFGKVAVIAYFAIVVFLFWLFYPVISGTPTSASTIDGLKWFGSWVF
jgi:dolichyl-phosphate-mannose-protein mannosyltransferase